MRINSACLPAPANRTHEAPHPVFHASHASRYNTLHFASQSRVPNGGFAPFGNPHKKRRYATPPRGAYRLFLLSSPPAVSVEQKSAWDWCGIFNYVKLRQRNCVIGTYIANELFEGEDPLGKSIKINNTMFTVVGVLEDKNGGTEGSSDDTIFIPYTIAQKLAGMFTI